jgi:hypothetical protein
MLAQTERKLQAPTVVIRHAVRGCSVLSFAKHSRQKQSINGIKLHKLGRSVTCWHKRNVSFKLRPLLPVTEPVSVQFSASPTLETKSVDKRYKNFIN